jgi:hypothetical protein
MIIDRQISRPLLVCNIVTVLLFGSAIPSHAETFGLRCGTNSVTVDTSTNTIRDETGKVIPATITPTSIDWVGFQSSTERWESHIERATGMRTVTVISGGRAYPTAPVQCQKTQGF